MHTTNTPDGMSLDGQGAIEAYVFQREEFRCAEIQDQQGLAMLCVFGPLFYMSMIIAGGIAINRLRARDYAQFLYCTSVIPLSMLGTYLVKNFYDYGRRSYKVALNLTKDRIVRLAKELGPEEANALFRATR